MAIEVETEAEIKSAVEFFCICCSKQVIVCRSCWRNQRYCSKECSHQGYLLRHRRAQKSYNGTELGRESHRERQKTYRLRQGEKNRD